MQNSGMVTYTMNTLPPQSESELFANALSLAGQSLGDLAKKLDDIVPFSLTHAKGWAGQLIEKCLGATAGHLPQPDFLTLGIELKTIPVNDAGVPDGSTYICTAPIPPIDRHWEHSRVWQKIAKILWIPIESSAQIPLAHRRVGYPILWSPNSAVAAQLKQDWEELTEQMILGYFDTLSAHHGHFLQIRPKAPNSNTMICTINHDGEPVSLVPKGFYLRTTLTQEILQNAAFICRG